MDQIDVYALIVWSWFVRAWALATVLALAMRTVPEARFVAIEKSFPRLGYLLRAVRKLAFDVVPFFQALVAAVVSPAQPTLRDDREPR